MRDARRAPAISALYRTMSYTIARRRRLWFSWLSGRSSFTRGSAEYELVPNWGQLPDGWRWGQCAGVSIDSEDNVHVYTRTDHPYMVFDKSGKFIDAWGENDFGMAHSLWINPGRYDSVYVTQPQGSLDPQVRQEPQIPHGARQEGGRRVSRHRVHQGGESAPLVPPMALGRHGAVPTYNGVGKSAGPFNEPTSIAQQPNNGFIFLLRRICKERAGAQVLSRTARLVIASWGELAGNSSRKTRNTKNNPNLNFHTPHGIGVYGDRVFVCDREHNRIQVFSQDGEFLDIWTMMERPTDMHIDKDGIVYISEHEDHVSIRDVQGNEIGRFGSERSHEPGKFWGPHSVWVDSEDNLYVGEVLEGQRVQKFARLK